ncbi:unnamed protein product, partial [Sphacelaria rigidula]
GWSGNSAAGAGGGDKRSELRVSSADHRVQSDVYWQSAAAESFQGILLSRITCRTCGRHSEQPDRFYDLSVPVLGTSPSASSKYAEAGAAAAAGAGRADSYHSYGKPSRDTSIYSMSPVVTEQPGPSFLVATSDGHNDHYHHSHPDLGRPGGVLESRSESRRSSARGGCGSSIAETNDWSWRKRSGGWCLAAHDRDGAAEEGGEGAGANRYG